MIKKAWIYCKRFLLPYPMAYTLKYLLRFLLYTCRLEFAGLQEFNAFAKSHRCILSLWHNRLAIMPEVLHRFTEDINFTAVISKSRDGQPLALLVDSYAKGKTLRVPHDDRHGALKKLIRQLKENHEVVVITPDGPRGPKYELKPGIALAAKCTQAYVVPFSWQADRCWQLPSWDGFMIPKPFSTIRIFFGQPLLLPPESSLKENVSYLQQELLRSFHH